MDHNFMKRMAPLLILEILRAHTDEEQGLKVSRIVELLESDYNVQMERKAVSRILNDLLEISQIPEDYDWKNPMGFSVECSVTPRSTGDIRDDWRLCREFEDAEVRLLTDAVLAMRNYPAGRLLGKLRKLGSPSLQAGSQYVRALTNRHPGTRLPLNVDALDRAIRTGKKVRFHYAEYGVDKLLHLRCGEDGQPREYTVSPYQLAFRDGHYYLICNHEKYDDIAHYRVDRIRDIQVLTEPAKAYSAVSGTTGWQLNIRQYLDQHIHMYVGQPVVATFRIPERMVSDVIDRFGTEVDFTKAANDTVIVRAEVNRTAMIRYAKTMAPDVRVLSPANLALEIRQELEKALQAYK